MRNPLLITLTTLLCTLTLQAASQIQLERSFTSYKAEKIESRDGFLQNTALNITQDERGYLWCSTPNGLYRWDGYNFEIFYNDPKDERSIESSSILSISEWFGGKLCFTNNNVINIFDPNDRGFQRIAIPGCDSSFRVTDLEIDRNNDGVVWILSRESIKVLQLNEDHSTIESSIAELHNLDGTPAATPYRRMISDKSGYIWLLSNNIVSCNRYSKERGVETIYRYYARNARELLIDRTGQVIIYSLGKITIINHNREQDDFYSDEIDIKQSGIQLDNLLLGSDGVVVGVKWGEAIYRLNLSRREITSAPLIIKQSSKSISTNMSKHRCSYIDNSGVLWIGTLHGGLYRVNLNHKPFNSLSLSVNDNYPNQITGDREGNVWIGTFYNGVRHINTNSGESYNSDLNSRLGLSENSAIFGITHHRDQLWYATNQGEISRAQCDAEGRITSHERVAQCASGLGFFYRGGEQLYYAVFNTEEQEKIYICRGEMSSQPRFEPLRLSDGSPLDLGGLCSLMVDSEGWLWIGTNGNGLYRCRLSETVYSEGGRSKSVQPEGVRSEVGHIESVRKILLPEDVESSAIFALYEDFQSNLYVGSFGGGLLVMPLGGDGVEHRLYTRSDGLANNAVYSICSGLANYLWISTDEGISRFSLTDLTFRNYDTSDGVESLNFRKWSQWKSPTGEIFFGGVEGVNYFRPEQIRINSLTPTIEITDFRVGAERRSYLPHTYHISDAGEKRPDVEPIELKPFENSFTFEFAALHFDNPDMNRYEYRLSGVDQQWRSASSKSRSVTYSNLSAGDYELLVRGSSSDGVWSKDYVGVTLRVLPYWWGTWWAKVGYLVVLALLLYLLYLYVLQRNKHHLENQMNRARLDFFTNISHEIKTPLTIISGALELNRGEMISPRDVEIIRRNNNRMLALVSQLLDFRKVSQGHAPFRPTKGDIVPLLSNIAESFELLAQRNNIAFRFTTTESSRELEFEADKIEKIVANLLSNAFKHTPKERSGEIELRLTTGLPNTLPNNVLRRLKRSGNHYTTISVSDNGEGISAENQTMIFEQFYQVGRYNLTLKHRGVGVGLAYSKLLTELHEGEIFVSSEVGGGSTFFVVLPRELSANVERQPSDEESVSEQREVDFLVEWQENTAPNQASANLQHDLQERQEREILIVEDNQEIREFLHKVLSPHYTVHEAEDGVQGLELAERLIPDIIVSDVMMPEMDGITLCNRLKEGDKTNHIPVILLTANSTIEHRVEGLRSGADSYISKPFNLEHLMVRIEKLLEIRTLLKRKYMKLSGVTDLEQIEICDPDKEFLAKVEALIEENLEDSEFTVEALEQAMDYSHVQLYRKIKSISGVTVVEFIRNYRLKRSVDMMRRGSMRINEIMYAVGFATPSYYSKSFKKRYGKSPQEFQEELKQQL